MQFTAVVLSIALSFSHTVMLFLLKVKADPVNTQVIVSGNPPTITGNPAENPASDSTTPTNAGSSVTFQATGHDNDNDNFYLAICKSNAITPGGPGSPTCGGGNWCISGSTASDGVASCSYSTITGDVQSNDWYAFVCDAVAGQQCSASSQGTGSSGSPFAVNHVPSFSGMTDGSADPGGSITFTATASDADNDGAQDQVKLFVCGTAGATSSGCTGTTLCSAALTNSNPSCNYTLPSVIEDGNYTYYPYIFDSHNLAAASNPLGSVDYTVNNVSPVVSNVVVNSSADINLTENTTTPVIITGTVSDNNSCLDINTVEASLYRSAITYAGCDTAGESNENYCYAAVSCSVSGASCTGNTDSAANYTCTINVKYNADPTDVNTQHDAENWLASLKATDNGSNTHNSESPTPVEMISLIALNVTSTINYGSILAGNNSASPFQATVTATGNVGLDTELSGINMTSGGNNIAVGQQQYSTATFTYGNGTALSGTPTLVQLNVLKTTDSNNPASKNLYWAIGIPVAQAPGTYTGTNAVTAIKGEVGQW